MMTMVMLDLEDYFKTKANKNIIKINNKYYKSWYYRFIIKRRKIINKKDIKELKVNSKMNFESKLNSDIYNICFKEDNYSYCDYNTFDKIKFPFRDKHKEINIFSRLIYNL